MSQSIFTEGIGYEGKVTLTLKSNNRVLESKTYKNSGTAHLFKFLGHCLIGSYDETAKTLLPTKIALLYNAGNGIATEVDDRSLFIGLAQTPTIISENNEVRVTYSFEVPKSAIEGNFNQIALYGAGITSKAEFSAYYYLTDDYGNLAEQTVGDWSSTTILLIEWELSLSNKTTEVTSTDDGADNGGEDETD